MYDYSRLVNAQRPLPVFAKYVGIGMLPFMMSTSLQAQTGPTESRTPPIAKTAIVSVSETSATAPDRTNAELVEQLRQMQQVIQALDARLKELESRLGDQATTVLEQTSKSQSRVSLAAADPDLQTTADSPPQFTKEDKGELDFLRDTTINLSLDGYYGFNFNRPIGRVNLLRAYDVLSNAFSVNQASVIFEHAPDPAAGRRFGGRIDLQFGQATDTLQGNPANEPRPQIYRNIFQAYGTFVAPVGKGLTVDVGKWASALGIESNYNKDQMNYSRSYWFNFLPFYHMGVRANYRVNDKLALNYWLVNGTQQTEPFNSFKDEMFGVVVQPKKSVSWTVNYYLGQEHPDVTPVPPTGTAPVQPGLSFAPIRPSPDGRLHIFDSYVTWQTTPKLTLAFEADYVIQRLWRHDAPGQPSSPAHVAGGAAYARYQFTPKFALAGRAEYLSDRGGMFSGVTQALKETTLTFEYKLADGFVTRYEWRRDFSNQPYFLTRNVGVFSKQQNTAMVGLIWWWGRKEGTW